MMMLRMLFAAGLVGMPLCQGQSATPEKFDVASVKVNPYSKTSCGQDARGCSIFPTWNGATFTATNVSLDLLVQIAYGVDSNQISGGQRFPSDRYDVSAKPASGLVTAERARPMLRALLEERFGLKTHRETREVSGYALVVAKGGPKLKAAGDTPKPFVTYPGGLDGGPADATSLASMVTNLVKRPVVNKTDLAGNYDLRLRFAPDGDTKSTLPSLFTAIQEQLGLRLESQKVPVEFLVIDQCSKTPSEN
jgi:uncharacterized protein (TIGR03435 family)